MRLCVVSSHPRGQAQLAAASLPRASTAPRLQSQAKNYTNRTHMTRRSARDLCRHVFVSNTPLAAPSLRCGTKPRHRMLPDELSLPQLFGCSARRSPALWLTIAAAWAQHLLLLIPPSTARSKPGRTCWRPTNPLPRDAHRCCGPILPEHCST